MLTHLYTTIPWSCSLLPFNAAAKDRRQVRYSKMAHPNFYSTTKRFGTYFNFSVEHLSVPSPLVKNLRLSSYDPSWMEVPILLSSVIYDDLTSITACPDPAPAMRYDAYYGPLLRPTFPNNSYKTILTGLRAHYVREAS